MRQYEYDYGKLRGRIREILGTEREFARLIGRTATHISLILNGEKQFTQSDILKAVTVLDIDPRDIGVYFFTLRVHKSETMVLRGGT